MTLVTIGRRGAPSTGSPPKGGRFITRALQKDQPGRKVLGRCLIA